MGSVHLRDAGGDKSKGGWLDASYLATVASKLLERSSIGKNLQDWSVTEKMSSGSLDNVHGCA